MIIKWREHRDGETVEHEWTFSGAPKLQEARWIKQRTGWSIKGFLDALDEMDPDAVIALIVLLSARDGRKLSWDSVDLDPVTDFEILPSEDELAKVRAAQAEQEAAARGKAVLPPALDLADLPSRSGNESGLLAKAASTHNGSPTPPSSGFVSA